MQAFCKLTDNQCNESFNFMTKSNRDPRKSETINSEMDKKKENTSPKTAQRMGRKVGINVNNLRGDRNDKNDKNASTRQGSFSPSRDSPRDNAKIDIVVL